jgi:predicted PurR-regulated permease PerM
MWWFIISGLAFLFSLLLNVALLAVLLLAYRHFQHTGNTLTTKVSELSDKLDTVIQKADNILKTTQSTVQNIQERSIKIFGSAESASEEATRKISAIGSSLASIYVAARIAGALRNIMTGYKTEKTRKK